MSYPYIDVSEYIDVTSIDGSLDRGGWECRFTSMNDSDVLEPYHYVQLWWQGVFGTKDPEYGRVGFQGHVLPLQISFDRIGSLSTFIASTTDAILKKGWCQGIHFRDTGAVARTHYHSFDNVTGVPVERMTMGRIVRHLLGYYDQLGAPPATNPDWVAHTNLVYHASQNPHGWITLDNVTQAPFSDPANLEGSMRVDHYIVRETNNLWETIRQIARNEFFIAYFDKENNFYYRRHPMYGNTLPDPVMEFTQEFTVGKPIIYLRENDTISDIGTVRQVKLHAVTDDGNTMHADYPSSPTHVYGKVDEITYIRCNSQDALDHWAEIHYKFQNRDCTVRWTAPGLCGLLFDILDRVEVTYSGTAVNGVHVNWTDKKFWIHNITVDPNDGFSGTSVFTLEAENV